MTNKFLRRYFLYGLSALVLGSVILYRLLPDGRHFYPPPALHAILFPDINQLPESPGANMIRYGKRLITNTAVFLGPNGSVAALTNGMNCGNCHLEAGTRTNGNWFLAVASTYPKFRPRSGKVESVEFRVNDCMQRSLNGKPLDSNSYEMKAMVAYIKWIGKDFKPLPKNKTGGTADMPLLSRAASVTNGGAIYNSKCVSCHAEHGSGVLEPDSSGYQYPPLWGMSSYNISAGMYRISNLATFIKYNMPYTEKQDGPLLSNEDAWDVAAYITAQQRPVKLFHDWPDISKKPFDFPFGPYADAFPESQHKFGPFAEIKRAGKK